MLYSFDALVLVLNAPFSSPWRMAFFTVNVCKTFYACYCLLWPQRHHYQELLKKDCLPKIVYSFIARCYTVTAVPVIFQLIFQEFIFIFQIANLKSFDEMSVMNNVGMWSTNKLRECWCLPYVCLFELSRTGRSAWSSFWDLFETWSSALDLWLMEIYLEYARSINLSIYHANVVNLDVINIWVF